MQLLAQGQQGLAVGVTLQALLQLSQSVCPLTGAVESEAATLQEVVQEMLLTTTSERQGRLIDSDQAGSMEEKKRKGYF